MEFVEIMTYALTDIRSDLVDSGSGSSSNMGSATSVINLKSLEEANTVLSLFDPMGMRGKQARWKYDNKEL